MQTIFIPARRLALLISTLCLAVHTAQATVYTAISSGNFSSTSVWTGGIVPPVSVTGDDIIIPSGLIVGMDQNIVLQSSSSLTVNGTLNGTTGKFIAMNAGTLNGAGTIDVDSFSAAFTTGFNFAGTFDADVFRSANAMINSTVTMGIKNTLYLTAGTMTMAHGDLGFSPGATIQLSGGAITITSGSIDLSTKYNVTYKGVSAAAGVELTGVSLTDVTIDVPAADSIALSADLVCGGVMTLASGVLDMNGHDIVFDTLSSMAATGKGEIKTSALSSIYVFAKNGLSGLPVQQVVLSYPQLKNLVIGVDIGKKVVIGSQRDLELANGLVLASGLLDIANNQLRFVDTARIYGGDATSYILTSSKVISSGDYGSVVMPVSTDSTRVFPVGTDQHYAPCIIANKPGSVAIEARVSVSKGMKEHGGFGWLASTTEPVVDATWSIYASGGPVVDVDLTVMWDAGMEVNSFNRNNSFIAQCAGPVVTAAWDRQTPTAATLNANGMYSQTRKSIKNLFVPFAVFDNKTLGVDKISLVRDVKVYPNPATDVMNISFTQEQFGAAQLTIRDVLGKTVSTIALQEGKGYRSSKVNVGTLPAGVYAVNITTPDGNAVTQFVKQ